MRALFQCCHLFGPAEPGHGPPDHLEADPAWPDPLKHGDGLVMAEAGQRLPVHGEILVPLTQLAIIRGLSQHNKLLFVHSKFKSNTQIFGSDRSSRNAIARLSVHVAQVCQEHRTQVVLNSKFHLKLLLLSHILLSAQQPSKIRRNKRS